MRTLDLLQRVENVKVRSAWNNGVKTYAIELLDDAASNLECGDFSNLHELKEEILNGASDWMQYSEGGCSLIYNADIAKRLCTPSELKKTKNGLNNPNSRETWLDVQARALFQAWEMIKQVYNEMPKQRYSVMPYPAAPNLWCVYDNYYNSVVIGYTEKLMCKAWIMKNSK